MLSAHRGYREKSGSSVNVLVVLLCLMCSISSVNAVEVAPEDSTVTYDLTISRVTSEDGLSNDSVTSILQDRNGYMWFGTIYGLNRFDGYNFEIYKHLPSPDSLSDNWVKAIFQDRKGDIWIGANRWLDRLDPDSRTFKHYNIDAEIYAIQEDVDGVLWVGSGKGLLKYDRETDKFSCYPVRAGQVAPTSQPKDSPKCDFITSGRRGMLWIGDGFELYEFDRKKEHLTSIRERFPILRRFGETDLKGLLVDRAGNTWISTMGGGLIKLNVNVLKTGQNPQYIVSKQYKNVPGDDGTLSDNDISSMYQTRQGELWFGTGSGTIHLYDEKNDRFIRYKSENIPGQVMGYTVMAIFEDRYDVLWAAVYGKGLVKIVRRRKQFTPVRSEPGRTGSLSNSSVLAIYKDSRDVLWIGTTEGLNRCDPGKSSFVYYYHDPSNPVSLIHNVIRTIAEDKFGRLWVGTHKGAGFLNRKTGTFTNYPGKPGIPGELSSPMVKKIYKDRAGELWFGTRNGLNRFDYDRGRFIRYPDDPVKPGTLNYNYVFTILEDRNGALWLGTMGGGLNCFDRVNGRFNSFVSDHRDPETLSNDNVLSLLEDAAGNFWVGTKDGLNRMDRASGRFTRFYEKDGLPNNIIYGIQDDEQGNLWLSTNKGICKFNPQQGVLKNYSASNGLQSNEFNGDVSFKDRDGQLYFGGITGFNAFYPHDIEGQVVVPQVRLNYVYLVGEKPATVNLNPEQTSIELSYNVRVLFFSFSVLDFRVPKQNRYLYTLEGFDKQWRDVRNLPFATYTNLKPGTYVFKLKGADSSGTWSKEEATITIYMPPPFWQTTWFKLLFLFFTLAFITLLVRRKINRVMVQKKKLEQQVAHRTAQLKKKTEELEIERRSAIEANRSKSDFLARMSHEIRTPMNSVIGFTEMLLDSDLTGEQRDFALTINQSGEVLLMLINDILDLSKIEAGEMTLEEIEFSPEETAFGVCDLILPRIGDKNIEIICNIDNRVPSYVGGDPGRFSQVLINLMGNAAKFTEEGTIELVMRVMEEQTDDLVLHTAVKDTGIGIPENKQAVIFDAFQQADGSVTRQFGGSGLGLAIARQIAESMAGDLTLESTPGSGSVFNFTARVSKSGRKTQKFLLPDALEGKKILVVDDNRNNREVLTHTLEIVGAQVTALPGGDEALAAIDKNTTAGEPFQLGIIDIQMPGMSGYELCEKIRAGKTASSKMPLLAFSSSISKQSQKWREVGFNLFLYKPVRRWKILETVLQMLKEFQTGSAGAEAEVSGRGKNRQEAVFPGGKVPGETIHILLVEDNPINRKLAGFMLTRVGYEVEYALNGRDAVDMYSTKPEKYDLILMDIQMPEMDGKDASRRIREKGFREVPIIAMTAHSMQGDKDSCLEAGMNDYISKPIKSEVVYRMVEKWIHEKSQDQFISEIPKSDIPV
jgi:signal transduction histidine kinase/ligand-binding sensor domain-containing protein/DNA-binding response OmpR family regulator